MANTKESKFSFEAWLTKIGWPQNVVEYASSPEGVTGPLSNWTVFTDYYKLPLNQRVLIRAKDKRSSQVLYVRRDEESDSPNPSIDYISDKLETNKIAAREAALDEREKELQNREDELRTRDEELNKKERAAINEQQEVSRALDNRTKANIEILQEWDKKNRESSTERLEWTRIINELQARVAGAEEKHAIAASVTYLAERAGGFAAIAKAKTSGDVPAEMVEDFQGYLKDKATRRYFASLPLAGRRVFNDWLALPETQKMEFMSCCKNYYQDKKDQANE